MNTMNGSTLTDIQLAEFVTAIAHNLNAAKMLVEIVDQHMISGIWGELARILNGILNDKDVGLNVMLSDWNGFWEE